VIPYEWVNARGDRVLQNWDLEPHQRRQLTALLRNLEKFDLEMAFNTLIFKKGGARAADIYYSKINGVQALRPRSCLGPELTAEEFRDLCSVRAKAGDAAPPERAMLVAGREEVLTFLERVTKKDNAENPLMKDSKAPERLQGIREQRALRRLVVFHREKPWSPKTTR
jgi:hypothetical protein